MSFTIPTNFAFGHENFSTQVTRLALVQAMLEVAEAHLAEEVAFRATARSECLEAKKRERVLDSLARRVLEDRDKVDDEHRKAMKTLQEKYDKAEVALEEAGEKLAKANNTISQHEASILQLEGQATAFENQFKAEKVAHATTQAEATTLKKSVDDQEKYIKSIEKQLQAKTDKVTSLESLEEQRKKDLDTEKKRARDTEVARTILSADFEKFKNDCRGLSTQYTVVQQELTEKKDEIEKANTALAGLQDIEARLTEEKDAIIADLRTEIAALRVDAVPRMVIRPNAYRDDPDAPAAGPRDLNEELGDARSAATESESPVGVSSDGSAGSDDETEGEVEKEVDSDGKEPVAPPEIIRVVEVPGPVVRTTQFITRVVRDSNPLRAWLYTERAAFILLVSFFAFITQPLVGGLRSLRSLSFADDDPLPVPHDGTDSNGNGHGTGNGNANAGAGAGAGANGGIHMASNISVGVGIAPGGPAPGTDPGYPTPASSSTTSASNINLEELLPPIDPPSNDQREQFQNQDGNARDNDINNVAISVAQGPPLPVIQGPEGFFDLRNVAQPPIISTIIALIVHLIVYYFIWVCYSCYDERKMWLAANESTRSFLFQLLQSRNRYSQSIFHFILSESIAARIDGLILMFVQLFGVQIKAYPLPG
ncbi:hypothetical protein EG329_000081 [Mollisiaceae sp. DMI_Dod_QoI]|nr:hypothetical protein EG329_000081 [Helotiales sp. DMI_Dod_QoI]